MKSRVKRVLLAVATAFAVIVIGFPFLCPIVNNISARQVMDSLCDLPLPERTRQVEAVSRAGKLAGSGNGMDFLGVVLLESELTLEELDAYYEQFQENSWTCQVAHQEGQRVQLVEHGQLDFKTPVTGENYYILYTWGNGIELFAAFDLRGH